jgi:hypothetical protein
MNPLYATVDGGVGRYMLVVVEYGFIIDLFCGHFPFFYGRWDVYLLCEVRRLREGMIPGVRAREGGGTKSP